jgi:hypothetical protein
MDLAERITRLEDAVIDLTTVAGEHDFGRFLRHEDPAVSLAAERVLRFVGDVQRERSVPPTSEPPRLGSP